MILLFNNQPVTLNLKTNLLVDKAASIMGSEFNLNHDIPWFGDNLSVESLFPEWILKEYEKNTSNVLIISLIKNYLRWLFSQEYGYGAQLNWENIRIPLYMNDIFLEALADFYFNGADFSTTPLSTKLSNIRNFATNVDANYFNIKGTPLSIKNVMCSLLGFSPDDVYVTTGSGFIVQISVSSAQESELNNYKSFLERYVIPAGVSPIYSTF